MKTGQGKQIAILMLAGLILMTTGGAPVQGRERTGPASVNKVGRFLDPGVKKPILPSYVQERLSVEDLPTLYAALKNGDISDVYRSSEASKNRVLDYLATSAQIVFTDAYIRQRLSATDLAALHSVLEDDKQARHWRQALWAVCVLEEDREALETVTRVTSRYWNWREAGYPSQEAGLIYLELAGAIASLSMVDPNFSGPILTEVFSRKGAREYLGAWREAELPDMTPFETSILNFATAGAGSGLLHSRSPELFAVVEDTFQQIGTVPVPERTEEERQTLHTCVQLMAQRDIYLEFGWEKGLEYVSSLGSEEWLNVILSRSRKYYEPLNRAE